MDKFSSMTADEFEFFFPKLKVEPSKLIKDKMKIELQME